MMPKVRRGRTRVSPKHQITIPVDVLREAGLQVGDPLEVTVEGAGRVRIRRIDDPIARFAGRLPGVWAADDLDRLRDEWR